MTVISDDKTVKLDDGTTINYVTSGDGCHPVLLLPGALGTGRMDFTPQLEGMNRSGQLRLIAWDPPGYGKSRPPNRTFPDNVFARDADCAVKFMKTLGHRNFSIVGWSDGGITALFLAANYTSEVKKMVAHAANSYFENTDIEIILKMKDVANWPPRMREPMEHVYGKDYFPMLWSEWTDAMMKIANASPDKNICRELLPKIQCSTLIVHGNKDPIVDSGHPEVLHRRIPNAKVVIFPEGKHNLHFEYKDRFNKLVEDFLIGS